MTNILISTAYFPPISYLKAFLASERVFIEQHENFIKKTYRNRCRIYAANGVINLTVPVEEAARRKVLIKDVKIDYSTNWQKQHFKSIKSAYNSSPFYEYLIDDFTDFFNKKTTFLFDLNNKILKKIINILELKSKVLFTEEYIENPSRMKDFRSLIQLKKETNNPFISNREYPQVFSNKYGFCKDLSCLDLFFNLGSEAYSYLIDKF